MKKIVNGKEVTLTAEQEAAVIAQREADAAQKAAFEASVEGVRQRRRALYPEIGEQLDAIWHAMDTGVLTRVPEFYNPIKAVKDANPLPNQ